jgi:hypothetical protein
MTAISLYAALSDAQNLSWRWFTRDDAYYYFKVAQNISEGRGSTFDGINRTNGYHPLWMMVCIPIFALARFDLILPLRILLLVMGALSAATALLFYRLLGRIFHPAIGALAALFWAFNYDLLARVYMQGLETGIAVFFVVLLIYKIFEFEISWRNAIVTNRQFFNLGFLALLMVFSRLDLIFLAGMIGVWLIFRMSPLRYLLPLDIASILVSTLLAFILRLAIPDFREYYRFKDAALTMLAVSLAVKLPLAYFMGLYRAHALFNAKEFIFRFISFLVIGSAATAALMLVLARVEHFEGFPRIAIAYDLVITAVLMTISRLSILGLTTSTSNVRDVRPFAYLKNNWKQWRSEGTAYYGILGAGMAIYMLYNKAAFGTFSPVSGLIKRWWGSLPGKVYDGPTAEPLSFFGISSIGESNTFHPASTLFGRWAENLPTMGMTDTTRYLAILGLFSLCFHLLLFINRRKAKSSIAQLGIIPLITGSVMQVVYYHAPGYAAYKEWYWVSQLVLVVLAAGIMAGMLFVTIRKIHFAQYAAWSVAFVLGLSMLFPFWSAIRSNMTYNEWKPDDPINDIAAFLEAHTEPGSIIGMTGGGNAAYFIRDRTVINMDGLINSYDYFQLLQKQQAGEYLANEGMDYILANNTLLEQLPYKGQFAPYIEWMDVRYGGKDLMRYGSP